MFKLQCNWNLKLSSLHDFGFEGADLLQEERYGVSKTVWRHKQAPHGHRRHQAHRVQARGGYPRRPGRVRGEVLRPLRHAVLGGNSIDILGKKLGTKLGTINRDESQYVPDVNAASIFLPRSGGLSKDEIENMVRDAEAHAADDKLKKDRIEASNQVCMYVA